MTTLVTEAAKKMLGDRKYSANLLAACLSVVVSVFVCGAYVITKEVALTPKVWVGLVSLVVLSWLCSMLGFDKVKQTLLQLRGDGQ